jgi:hypothetical protein
MKWIGFSRSGGWNKKARLKEMPGRKAVRSHVSRSTSRETALWDLNQTTAPGSGKWAAAVSDLWPSESHQWRLSFSDLNEAHSVFEVQCICIVAREKSLVNHLSRHVIEGFSAEMHSYSQNYENRYQVETC